MATLSPVWAMRAIASMALSNTTQQRYSYQFWILDWRFWIANPTIYEASGD
jgi:P pilus assembly chaperone PapD